MTSIWQHRHLFDVTSLSKDDIHIILQLAHDFFLHNKKSIKNFSYLQGKNIILFFGENSTRTRMSFEIAGQRLGATTHFIQKAGSSMQKGETLQDTMLTLNAMQPSAFVIRSEFSGVMKYIEQFTNAPILNAGDGWHAHPTQALLDLLTLHLEWNGDYTNKTLVIVGDTKHSRVARSNIHLLQKMGISVRLCSPPTLSFMPNTFEGVENYTTLEKAVEGVDAIMALRLQLERQTAGLIPQEYFSVYGITEKILQKAKPNAIVLHPGPVNPNIDIASSLINHPQISKITTQVEAGVAIRMALLYLFCSENPSPSLAI